MTQDEIIEMAMLEAEFVSHGKPSEEESELFVCTDKDIVRFYKLVAAKEREACAKVCETGIDTEHPIIKGHIMKDFGASTHLADAIRARGQA